MMPFVPAKDLKPGDQVSGPDGGIQTVASTKYEPHREGIPVYNFEVEGFHTYFVAANGSRAPPVLVHNQCHTDVFPENPDDFGDIIGDPGIGRPNWDIGDINQGRFPPERLPDRNRIDWDDVETPGGDVLDRITYEQHPYHPEAPPSHREPHYHIRYPDGTRDRYRPGDPLPPGF